MNPITSPISFAIAGKWSAVVATTVLSLGLLGGVRPPVAQPAANTDRVISQEKAQPAMTEFAAEVPVAVEAEPELLHAITPEFETPAPLPVPSEGVPLPRPTHTIWVQVTAYCSCKKCCGPLARGITASGRSVQYNGGLFVAADTKLLPFGTRLIVPGYAGDQPVEVIDRGGAIRGHHIDVFFPTHEQAKAWGVRWMQITVVD